MWLPLALLALGVSAFLWALRARRLSGPTIYLPAESLPILGALWPMLANYQRHHDWKLEWLRRAEKAGKEAACWSVFGAPPHLELASTRAVKYVLQDGFDNFESEEQRRSAACAEQLHPGCSRS
jgi:hypothetical protein